MHVNNWNVVCFLEESTVEVVPSQWIVISLNKVECFWPPKSWKNFQIRKAVTQIISPECDWSIHAVKVLAKCNNLSDAHNKAEKAQYTSDIQSSAVSFSDSEDESYRIQVPPLPPVPPMPVTPNKRKSSVHESSIRRKSPRQSKLSTTVRKIFANQNDSAATKPTGIVYNTPNTPTTSEGLSDGEFKRQVIQQLMIINHTLKQHSENFEILLQEANNVVQQPNQDLMNEVVKTTIDAFPIDDEEGLRKLEDLFSNQHHSDAMTKELSRVGGRKTDEIVKRVMSRLFTNNFASKFSWYGKKGKMVFYNLSVVKIIIRAVALNRDTKNATEAEVERSISTWLRRAKERHQKQIHLETELSKK